MSPDAEQSQPFTDALREAIADAIEAGETFKGLERETGVLRQSLMKFARGETSLRLDLADRLAAYFGLEVRKATRSKGK
jgi:plasmid maintenance system antidote protein VapI